MCPHALPGRMQELPFNSSLRNNLQFSNDVEKGKKKLIKIIQNDKLRSFVLSNCRNFAIKSKFHKLNKSLSIFKELSCKEIMGNLKCTITEIIIFI
jgi:hypothetical protein